jgi:serine/threonine protein phosphatase PrpC
MRKTAVRISLSFLCFISNPIAIFFDKFYLAEILRQAFLQTDSELPRDQCEYQGCTGTVAYLWERDRKKFLQGFPSENAHCFPILIFLSVANVGDSFAYLVTANDVIDMTAEHSLSILSERERICSMGVELYDGQTRVAGLKVISSHRRPIFWISLNFFDSWTQSFFSQVTRALGDLFTKQIDSGVIADPYVSQVIQINEEETAFLVLASDGVCVIVLCFLHSLLLIFSLSLSLQLWDVVSGRRARDMIFNNPSFSAQKHADNLLKTAVGSTKCHDNVTVIVVKLSWKGIVWNWL